MRMGNTLLLIALLVGCSAAEQPSQAATAEDGTLVVANKGGNSVSRIDLATGAETHRAESCANPHELAVSPDRQHVALGCYSGSGLEIFRTADLVRVKRIELGEGARPHGLVWHSSGKIVASAEGRGSIFVVESPLSDSARVREIGSGALGPHMVAVDAAGETAWGTIIPGGAVVRYDLVAGRETARRRLGGDTEGIALSPDGSALWVGANAANKVFRLDPATLEAEAEIPVGQVPIRVAAHPAGRWVATSDFGDGALSVIDSRTNTVARTIQVSGNRGPAQVTLAFSDDGSRVYVAETAANTIAEIDFAGGKLLRRLPAGPGGDGLAVFE